MEKMSCNFCQYPFLHYAQYYIKTGYPSDAELYILRKENSIGGMAIEYCPLCGRNLRGEYI